MADEQLPPITELILEPRASRQQLASLLDPIALFTFTGEDVLELSSWCGVSGVTIALQGRFRDPSGKIVPFAQTQTANSNRTIKTDVFTVPYGDLLNLVVFCSAGSPVLNQVFVRVSVRRGAGVANTRLGNLVQGPITANIARAWPGSPVVSPFDTHAAPRLITGTGPGAGLAILETVPTGALWELVNFHVPLTYVAGTLTAFTVPLIIKDASGNQIAAYRPTTAYASNSNATNTWGAAYTPSAVASNDVAGSLPAGLILAGGFTLNLSALAGTANWGTPRYAVNEWVDI